MAESAKTPTAIAALAKLLDTSKRPIYAVDADREIVFCNAALVDWLGLVRRDVVGRYVEYHSEYQAGSADNGRNRRPAPLNDLSPPPEAMAGVECAGTVSCVARDGRLVHRRAEFKPLASETKRVARRAGTAGVAPARCGVLVLLDGSDMSPEELSARMSREPTGDELHHIIRRFRRTQAAEHAVESLIGECSAMRRVRSQVVAAAASQANVLICGPRGSGRSHIARAIHYRAAPGGSASFIAIDAQVTTEEVLRDAFETLRHTVNAKLRGTLLVANLERLALELQSQLLPVLTDLAQSARIIATTAALMSGSDPIAHEILPALFDGLSTITIEAPPLVARLDDLPLLAQCFLESCNRGSPKQIGAVRSDALDHLALHRWPGELDELRSVIAAAHLACSGHEITPADLPAVVHHAGKAASTPRRVSEKIVLDDLLTSIERDVIVRALSQSGGNKSAAAELLGMTRPRLYRRLIQLGLASETSDEDSQ